MHVIRRIHRLHCNFVCSLTCSSQTSRSRKEIPLLLLSMCCITTRANQFSTTCSCKAALHAHLCMQCMHALQMLLKTSSVSSVVRQSGKYVSHIHIILTTTVAPAASHLHDTNCAHILTASTHAFTMLVVLVKVHTSLHSC